ncbi:MAG: sterol desaturase family protein [Panacagrimonas sp.]
MTAIRHAEPRLMGKAFWGKYGELGFFWGFILAYDLHLSVYLIALAFVPFSAEWKTLSLPQGLLLCLAIQVTVYLIVTTGVWLAYGGLRRHLKIGGLLDPRPLGKGQIAGEIRSGFSTCVVYAVYTFVCLKLSVGVWPDSWVEGVLQVAAFVAFYDLCFYLSHRLMHGPALARFHGHHHESVRVTPWSVHSLHPVEAAINQLPFLLFMLVWPVGFGMIALFQVLLMYGTASGHSNYDPFANMSGLERAKGFWRFHQRHHEGGRGNFGFMGLHWDWVFGTAQTPKA